MIFVPFSIINCYSFNPLVRWSSALLCTSLGPAGQQHPAPPFYV